MDSQWEYTAEGSQGYSQPYSYPPPADALPLTGEADFEAQRAVHALLYPAQSQPTNADASNPRSTDQEALHAALLAQQAQQVTTYENILLHNSPPAQPVQVQHSSLSPYSTFDTVYTSDETATYGSNYQYYGAGGMPEYSTDSQPISADLTTSTPATTTRGGGWTSTPAEPKRIAVSDQNFLIASSSSTNSVLTRS